MTIDAQWTKKAALEAGFDACGIAAAGPIPQQEWGLEEWLGSGREGGMHYMEEHTAERRDPTVLVAGAKSVVSVLLGYKPSRELGVKPRIAQYAYGEDYHERMKRMLYRLLAMLRERYPAFEARPFVDTAPISDKYWAVRAGLGWRGKNTLLVNSELGSYCYIGELVTTAEASHYDSPVAEGCGTCELCVQACPNRAIVCASVRAGGTQVDARRCASYHTIENRDASLPQWVRLSGYAFGCDCCALVCPYNHRAAVRYELTEADLGRLALLADCDEATFKRATRHSAMNRIKYSQWQRNVAAARGKAEEGGGGEEEGGCRIIAKT